MAYVAGVRDALIIYKAMIETDRKILTAGITPTVLLMMPCVPPTATNAQTLSIVKKAMNDNPALLHNAAASFVSLALLDAWPCPIAK